MRDRASSSCARAWSCTRPQAVGCRRRLSSPIVVNAVDGRCGEGRSARARTQRAEEEVEAGYKKRHEAQRARDVATIVLVFVCVFVYRVAINKYFCVKSIMISSFAELGLRVRV